MSVGCRRLLRVVSTGTALVALSGCPSVAPTGPNGTGNSGGSSAGGNANGQGFVTFQLDNGHNYYMAAQQGATPVDVSAALGVFGPSADEGPLNLSPNASWFVFASNRFDPRCAGNPCLTVVNAALTQVLTVDAAGATVHNDGMAAISSDGMRIVFSAGDGPHMRDLWTVTRSGLGWSAPQLLTGDSPFQFNGQPAFSGDAPRVVFDGGDQPFGQDGTAICEVMTDGAGFHIVLTIYDLPAPGLTPRGALHSPDYAPDGSIVFEGDWDGEQVWRLPPGSTVALRVSPPPSGNDNSPCVLPDGRIASLLIGASGGPDYHELKLMNDDGSTITITDAGQNISDAGIGCGG